METYKDFFNRINSFETEQLNIGNGYFNVNNSLRLKVTEKNTFDNFYGDTVVFNLDDYSKSVLAEYQTALYEKVPNCFCEKLVSNTFHMTLHDLSSSNKFDKVIDNIHSNEKRLINELSANKIQKQTIKMRSKAVFNMINISLVLGLYPVDEVNYQKLMNLYYKVDKVQTLPYPLTPHITLAYYNINGFDFSSLVKLKETVDKLNKNSFDITLNTDMLFYQKFSSMNDYNNIFCLNNI